MLLSLPYNNLSLHNNRFKVGYIGMQEIPTDGWGDPSMMGSPVNNFLKSYQIAKEICYGFVFIWIDDVS